MFRLVIVVLGAIWFLALFSAPTANGWLVPTVDLRSEPANAAVTVRAGGEVIFTERTPCQLRLRRGCYDVELVAEGYSPWTKKDLDVPGDWYKDPIKLDMLEKVTPAPSPTVPITHDLTPVRLGDLRDFYVPVGWRVHLVAPVCGRDLECAWKIDGVQAAPDLCLWDPGTYPVSLTVTAPGGEQQTTESHYHVADSFRVSDPEGDALATGRDLRIVEIAFVPVFEGDAFEGYDASVIFRLYGDRLERVEGSSIPIQYRVELTSVRDGAVIRNAICLIGERDRSRRGSPWTWRKGWQIYDTDRWTELPKHEVAPQESPTSTNIAVRVRIPADFDPGNLSAWRACVLVDDLVVDETQTTGLAPSQ